MVRKLNSLLHPAASRRGVWPVLNRLLLPLLLLIVLAACNPPQGQSTPGQSDVLPTPQRLPTRVLFTPGPTPTPVVTPALETVIEEVVETVEPEIQGAEKTPTPKMVRLPGAYVQTRSAGLYETPGGKLKRTILAGSRVGLLERSGDGRWLHVQYRDDPEADPVTGWMRRSVLSVFADLDKLAVSGGHATAPEGATPAETESTDAIPATVTANRLNLRAGPGTNQGIIDALVNGEQVALVGRTKNGQWYQVQTNDGAIGWAASRWIKASADTAALPVTGAALTGIPVPKSAGAGGKIVFQTRNGGDIYIINADGSGLRKLTRGFDPALSPDGTKVAFTRFDEPPGLWIINTDGTGERQLFATRRPRSPSWTPDGQSIIFERNATETQCRSTPLGCYTDQEILDFFEGEECRTFTSIIDGSKVTYCISDFPVITDRNDNLVRYDLNTGSVRDLPASPNAYSPNHHPTDSRVLFQDREGLAVTRDAGNEKPQRLVDEYGLGPAVYSPDGKYIYTSRRSGDHWDIWRYNADGSNPVALTAPPGLRDFPIHNVAPTLSPDGKRILFLTNRRGGRWELWIMNADGSNPRPFAPQALAGIELQYDFSRERVADWGS